jgi:hypothetical protein
MPESITLILMRMDVTLFRIFFADFFRKKTFI